MVFFTPFNFLTVYQFCSTNSPVLFTKLHEETIEWEERRFFAYMAALVYQVISTEVENQIFEHNWIFRHWQSNGILILILIVTLSKLQEKPRRNDWVTGKST